MDGTRSLAPEALPQDDVFAKTLSAITPSLRQHLLKQLGTSDAADDVIQESCLRILRYRDRVEESELRALLFRIAANVIADRHRRAQTHHVTEHDPLEVAETHLPADNSQPEHVQIGRQDLALIIAAIRNLPPRCRQAFVLHRFDGLSYREIADGFGTSPRTVENQIAHALATCRRALGE
jgi:RNA polymerase sigma factor (sigma-70 family)